MFHQIDVPDIIPVDVEVEPVQIHRNSQKHLNSSSTSPEAYHRLNGGHFLIFTN